MPTPEKSFRPLPSNPNLEFDRKRAKSLLQDAREGKREAIARFEANHPRFSDLRDAAQLGTVVALHDAHLVIAREYGFASWPQWKQFVETRRLDVDARAAELVKAACSNDVRKARMMLEAEPLLARHDVYTACVCGEAEAVVDFISRDSARVSIKGGPLNRELLLYACHSRFLRADAERARGIVQSVKILLANGADPNVKFQEEFNGHLWLQSTLYGAAGIANNLELTNLLLEAGARLDPLDKETLYHSAEFPNPACLQQVLERGHPPKDQVDYCLGRATDFDYPAHVALFLSAGADPDYRINWDGLRTQLHKAVYLGRSAEIIRKMIDTGGDVNASDEHGVSILRSAVRNGDQAVIDLLKSQGAIDANISKDEGRIGEAITLCIAASRDDVATIDRLLDAGADVNQGAAPDKTPALHWAAWRGQLRAVRRLVERGADIHWRNTYGGDALGTTIHGSANCFDINGGPGMRLPEEAIRGHYPQIVQYLIERGCKLPEKISGGSDFVQEILRKHGVPDVENERKS